jgi:predicted metal-binding membrane protein
MESATIRPTPPLPGPTRVGLIGAVLALAAGAWVLTDDRMAGMHAAPGADLGHLDWFAVTWVAMMAAMMLPPLVPAALAFGRARERTVPAFVAGYLAAWTAAGLVAYLLVEAVRSLDLAVLAWDRAGRYVAAGVILAGAAYQLTAAKGACLDRCRNPLRLAREERAGVAGRLRGGLRHGASCAGCCAGLIAALFALGVMSLTWMVVVAALIAAERLLPWRTPAVYAVAAVLALLALWIAVAPDQLPGLTLPGSMEEMAPTHPA